MGTLSACIDWLSLSIQFSPDTDFEVRISRVLHRLGLDHLEWEDKTGHDGYRRSLQHKGITLNYDAVFQTNSDYVLLTFSGEGCRTWEEITGQEPSRILYAYPDWKVTRIDLAIDDRSEDDDYYLDLPLMMQHMDPRDPMFCSRLKKYKREEGNYAMEALFGSRSSRVFIRVYDKRLERIERKGECQEYHWVRLEVEFKAEKAQQVAQIVAMHPDRVGEITTMVLLDYIDFKTEPSSCFSDRNMRRDGITCDWWSYFLQTTEKLKLLPGPAPDRNIQTIMRWILTTCSRNLVIAAMVEGNALYVELERAGALRLTPIDQQIIADAKSKRQMQSQ